MILSFFAVILTFGLVVFLHEYGHFIMCRLFKVQVERFSFGFGPELLGVTTKSGTRFSICAIPLGGFVKPSGENLEECKGNPNEYFSKTWLERFGIVAAGPVMNYVLAFLLFFSVVAVRGMPEPSKEPVIGDLAQGYPAAVAGVQINDRILQVDGTPVTSWIEAADVIHKKPDQAIKLTIQRGGSQVQVSVVTKLDTVSHQGLIGIMPKTDYHDIGLVGAAKESLRQCWLWTRLTITTLAQKIYHRERPDVAGPVGIIQMVSRAAHSGLDDLVFLIGLISVAVGFFNILPVPLLDGGHAALYLWEGISRKKLTMKMINAVNSVGMVFLVSLLLFATYNDLVRIREERRVEKAARSAQTQPQ